MQLAIDSAITSWLQCQSTEKVVEDHTDRSQTVQTGTGSYDYVSQKACDIETQANVDCNSKKKKSIGVPWVRCKQPTLPETNAAAKRLNGVCS